LPPPTGSVVRSSACCSCCTAHSALVILGALLAAGGLSELRLRQGDDDDSVPDQGNDHLRPIIQFSPAVTPKTGPRECSLFLIQARVYSALCGWISAILRKQVITFARHKLATLLLRAPGGRVCGFCSCPSIVRVIQNNRAQSTFASWPYDCATG
jgi:hypothetical protein